MIWLAIALLWLVSFLFAGIEGGLLSINTVRLRQHVKQRTRGARRLARLLKNRERLLVTALLITNSAQILSLLLLTGELVRRFGDAGYLVALAVAMPVHLFLLGILPQSLFRRFPFAALAPLGGLLEWTSVILSPVLFVGMKIGQLFLPQRRSEQARLFAAREELKQVAAQSEREGYLTATERAMIHNVVDLRNVTARDVMVPPDTCVSVRTDASVEDVLALSRSHGVERVPVFDENGRAAGVVNVLDILLDHGERKPLRKYTRRIVAADEKERAYRMIRRLRAARIGLAAVVDERRHVVGIVSQEDLIKRLVRSA